MYFSAETSFAGGVIIAAIGIALAFYYAFCLLSFSIDPQIIGCHIKYNDDYPKSLVYATFTIYLALSIVPLIISTVKNMRLLGLLIFLSSLIAIIILAFGNTSVWCFSWCTN